MNRATVIYEAARRYETVIAQAAALGGWGFTSPRDRWSVYLMASYRYYEGDGGIFPDSMFDDLCRTVLAGGARTDWWHLALWDASALAAGSGFHTFKRVPVTLQSIAMAIKPLGGSPAT